ncbi:hypothetical protein KL925_003037 [Ogataea polymorpha]|nr:hypothetical protein KL925_003037 [Ogataea polymorpha]
MLSTIERLQQELAAARSARETVPAPAPDTIGPISSFRTRLESLDKIKIHPLDPDVVPARLPKPDRARVLDYLESLTFQEAMFLVDRSHFFLNEIYFPYDVDLLKARLSQTYDPSRRFSNLEDHSSTQFRALCFVVMALGTKYTRSSDPITGYLLSSALTLVLPCTQMKNEPENYVAVATLTLASLFFRSLGRDDDCMLYSNMAIQLASHIGLNKNEPAHMQQEADIRARVFWVSYGLNKTLAAKMGEPSLLQSKDISCPLPQMLCKDVPNTTAAAQFATYIKLSAISEDIFRAIYRLGKTSDWTETLGGIIQQLVRWNETLPRELQLQYIVTSDDLKHKRLVCSLHLNRCFCIHLTTIPFLYSLVEMKKTDPDFKISTDLCELLTICLNAAQMTVYIANSCANEGMLATYGVMDLDYIYSACLTFFICGDVLQFNTDECSRFLDSSLAIVAKMASEGNKDATVKHTKVQNLLASYRPQLPDVSSPGLDLASLDVPDTLWTQNPIETFQALAGHDLNIWEYGYKSWQHVDELWDDFAETYN